MCFLFTFIYFTSMPIYATSNNTDSLLDSPMYSQELEGEEYKLTGLERSFEPNIVHYDYSTQTIEYMYLNNSFNSITQVYDSYTSYTQNLISDGNPENGNLTNDLVQVSNPSSSPYNRIGITSSGGTAFLMGPNIALTAGHCVINSSSSYPRPFVSNIDIKFGFNGTNYYKKVNVTDVYILKLYYDEFSFANDWAICILDEYIGNELGFFGKCSGYDLIGLNATFIGYPGGQQQRTQYISTGEIVKNYPTFKMYAYGVSGFSGSPVFVSINGNEYVAGIFTYMVGTSFTGATRISSFLFDFLNYFLEENYRGVELRDYYYEGLTKIRYNTMSELIVSPREDLEVYLSNNGTNNFVEIVNQTKYFYTSTNTSTYVDHYNYSYFKNHNLIDGSYSNVYAFDSYFSTQALTAQYTTKDRTQNGDVISTTFDQNDNIWYHGGSGGNVIKGTIAYGGYAKNIEVVIPSDGLNLSQMVTINDVSFQLRTGPFRVSIIASRQLVCDSNIIFAFGVA